jgi:hypothetical protein
LRGENALVDTIALLPPDLGDALHYGAIVTGGWYPIEWYRLLHAAAQKATGEGPELSRLIAHDALEWDFRHLHKFVRFALSPETLMRLGVYVIRFYYTFGKMDVVETTNGFGRARFSEFVGFDRNLWVDILGGIEAVLELAGAKEVELGVTSGGGDGDTSMAAEARWKTG